MRRKIFLSLYDALGFERPVFVTLPPILRADRTKKLGKRDGAKDILEYRTEGFLPEAMMNYLALIGWNPGGTEEVFTKDELITRFSIDQIQRSGGAFDETKLKWFNREHILRLPEEMFLAYARQFLSSETYHALSKAKLLEKLVPEMRSRISTFGELRDMDTAGEFDFYTKAPTPEKDKILWSKEPNAAKTTERLRRVSALLELIHPHDWHDKKIKEILWPYAESEGRGGVLWPLRYALSGREKSPDPFLIASIIGKNETEERIKNAIETLS